MDDSGSAGFVIIVAILAFYFVPAVIAKIRNTAHQSAIFAINLFFGWTVLGWIAAVIWAVVEAPAPAAAPRDPAGFKNGLAAIIFIVGLITVFAGKGALEAIAGGIAVMAIGLAIRLVQTT